MSSKKKNPGLQQVPAIVKRLYKVVRSLEQIFPGRPFTPDGHLVGSLGEVIAASRHNLTLLRPSAVKHDAKTVNGKLVQIKITQRKSVALRSEPRHLIVLKLLQDGTTQEVYNGPGKKPWNQSGKMMKNGQRAINLSKLRVLMEDVPGTSRIRDIS